MEMLKNFFDCGFHSNEEFDNLDEIIIEYKEMCHSDAIIQLIQELHQIINSNNYRLAAKIIKQYGGRTYSLELTEKMIKYLYNKLTDQPAYLDRNDFVRKYKCKVVFCPICCPKPEVAIKLIAIEKANIIGKNMEIYICRPCRLVWTSSDDIRVENAQKYVKFMKKLGLKGLIRELENIDIL